MIAGALVGRLAELGWDRRNIGGDRRDGARNADDLRRRRAVARGRRPGCRCRGRSRWHAAVRRRRHGQARSRPRPCSRWRGGWSGGGRATADVRAPGRRADRGLAGLYGPGSEAWRLNREAVLLLGAGPRALLLQIAHPLVAEGVDQHSDFRADPWTRLAGHAAELSADRVRDVDDGARRDPAAERPPPDDRGRVRDAAAAERFGATYSARDPGLSLWVHATLVDSTLAAVGAWLGPDPARRPGRLLRGDRAVAPPVRHRRRAGPAGHRRVRRLRRRDAGAHRSGPPVGARPASLPRHPPPATRPGGRGGAGRETAGRLGATDGAILRAIPTRAYDWTAPPGDRAAPADACATSTGSRGGTASAQSPRG